MEFKLNGRHLGIYHLNFVIAYQKQNNRKEKVEFAQYWEALLLKKKHIEHAETIIKKKKLDVTISNGFHKV